MEDGRPQRKKSRFFSAGKSKLGVLLSKGLRHADNDSPETGPSSRHTPDTTDVEQAGNPAAAPEAPPNSQPAETAAADVATDPRPAQRVAFTSVADTRPNQDRTNRLSTATSALSTLSVRDTRRDGVYGPQALLQAAKERGNGDESVESSNGQPAAMFGNDTFSTTIFRGAAKPNPPLSALLPPPPFNAGLPRLPGQQPVQAQSHQPHPSYPPLAQGYQTHPVHGQYALPTEAQNADKSGQTHIPHDSGPAGGGKIDDILGPVESSSGMLSQNTDPVKHLVYSQTGQTVDLDRDVAGNLLPKTPDRVTTVPMSGAAPRRPIFNMAGTGITNLPLHATLHPTRRPTDDLVPPTLYTSPRRIEHARALAHHTRKRKRTHILPPPSYVWTRSNDGSSFNIFSGILLYPELCFHLASHLPLADLVSLYAISRDFHTIIDTRFTTVILSQATRKCPESSKTFPFRSYGHLCRRDPAARIPHPDPVKASQGTVRHIPSFRWLRMVLHREKVVHELMTVFAESGVPLPARCSLALKRVWYLMDIPDNARRIGFVHNRLLFTDLDLYFAMCFFVKLDMRCNDPTARECRYGLRRMLLAQRSLTTVLEVVKRQRWKKPIDVLRAWVEWWCPPPTGPQRGSVGSVFGVPEHRVGKLRFEYWGLVPVEKLGKQPKPLLRPDLLVTREVVRRGLRFHKHFLRSLLYGYVRMDTLEDYEPREITRRIAGLELEEYGVDDEIGGVEPLGEKDEGFDELLDLGGLREVSLKCVRPAPGLTRDEMKERELEEFWSERCMRWMEQEGEQLVCVDG